MTSVNDMAPLGNLKPMHALDASISIEENSYLPFQLEGVTLSDTNMLDVTHSDHNLDTVTVAAAIADIANTIQADLEGSIADTLRSVDFDKWHKSEEDLLRKLQTLCQLAKRMDVSASDRAQIIDAFDQVSTFAARSSNVLCSDPLVEGAQTGYWEVEIPNYSFLVERLGKEAIPVDHSILEITKTAEEIRTLLNISGGTTYSQISGQSTPRSSPKRPSTPVTFQEEHLTAFPNIDFSKNFLCVKTALTESLQNTSQKYQVRKLYDGLIAYLSYPNRSVDDLLQAYQFLHELTPKNDQKYNEAYKALLTYLAASCVTSSAAVKAIIATFDLEELMQQSILQQNFTLLILNGFEEPAQKASLINYFITDRSASDLKILLDKECRPFINLPDEEGTLPVDKAIEIQGLTQLEILLDSGAVVDARQKVALGALLHSLGSEAAQFPTYQRLQSYLL